MDLFIPDQMAEPAALSRVTHLGVGAHQDDLEFMAIHGILECFQRKDRWFGGITCTDGAGSARSGLYAGFSDAKMKEIRIKEQRKAAMIGDYAFMAQLGHSSQTVKNPQERLELVTRLLALFSSTKPEVVYTHNPVDKHATHIGVVVAVLAAIQQLPVEQRPRRVLGCEVWRDLDWLPDDRKVVLDTSSHPNLVAALNGVFDSQISGGKRYDRAVVGRRQANATFYESHSVDSANEVAFAIDLTPLALEDGLTLQAFVKDQIRAFGESALSLLDQLT